MKLTTVFFFLLFFFVSNKNQAQPPAPDFTITTTTGEVQQLYANYLDQNKTVVLKLFFVSCPPCNAMAPLMEPFYQSWGGGAGDVEFISLSIMANDENVDVAAYKATYGHTWPGAGSDGGSLPAYQGFTSGVYGTFFGTPTFIVIEPDGTVNFDPRGGNQSATIDSVDVAITATGARKPPFTVNSLGIVKDLNENPMAEVAITIATPTPITSMSDTTGTFVVEGSIFPQETYPVTATKDLNYSNGVSTLDIINIQKHILTIDLLDTPYQLLAADADHSGSISILDIIKLRRLILHIDEDLPDNPSWIFLDPDYVFTNPENPFQEVYNSEFAPFPKYRYTQPLEILGVKIGDVNGSANPEE